jgi:glycosyltransferase involved in cell wall biosynthesis
MKIIVSQIGKQHVNALLSAIAKQYSLTRFYTSIAANKFTPPQYIGKNWVEKVKRQHFTGISNALITHFLFIAFLKKILKSDYWNIKIPHVWFDKWVANRLKKADFDAVIGYENCNLASFKVAKQRGKITILDLASLHHTTQNTMLAQAGQSVNTRGINYMCQRKEQALAFTDYVFTLSDLAEKSLIDSGFPAERIYKTHLGVNHTMFKPKKAYNTEGVSISDLGFRISEATPPKSEIPNPKSNVLELYFVGTLIPIKGIAFLMTLLDALIERGLNIRLTLIGSLNPAYTLPTLNPQYCRHIPFLAHEELAKMHHALDLFVFPSHIDSWAQVVIEAMASGSPVLVSENTGAKEAVEQGGGVVLPIGNVMAWVSAIEFFYNNRSFLEKTGKKAASIAQQYTWDAYNTQVGAALSDIFDKQMGVKNRALKVETSPILH